MGRKNYKNKTRNECKWNFFSWTRISDWQKTAPANFCVSTQPTSTCSKSTMKTPEQWRHWRRSSVFIVNFKLYSGVSIVDFKQGNAGWEPRFYSLIELFSIFPFIFFLISKLIMVATRDAVSSNSFFSIMKRIS